MKIYNFDVDVGITIDQFGSFNVIRSRIAILPQKAHVSCMVLGPDGVIGYHQATIPQLFLVVEGEGWVRGESSRRQAIKKGQAAYWEKDEWHESGTETGMTAVVIEIEAQAFDPGGVMPES